MPLRRELVEELVLFVYTSYPFSTLAKLPA